MGELDGKTAIVTGANVGIGKAIATLFSKEGANVVITARRAELLESAAQEIRDATAGKVLAVPGDGAVEETVVALFQQVVAEFGAVDVLVNNAAIAGEFGNIWEQSADGFREALEINLMGPFLCTREAAKVMMPRRSGKIINIGSISGKRPLATRTPYTTSKLGLVGMTRTAALELGEYNINVNVLSPGAVDNDRMTDLSQRWGIDRDKFRDGAAALAPLKRVSENEDIASVALFLATDRSRNITGFDINCDGGVFPV